MKHCESCDSTHMGIVPCGLTYAQRLRSIVPDTEWMPAKNAQGATYYRENYWDDEPLKDMFGGADHKEREEQFMEETKGQGLRVNENPQRQEDFLMSAPEVDG